MSKPREFAHLLKNKFGSADNINSLSRNGNSGSVEEEKTHHGSATLPGNCSLTTTTTTTATTAQGSTSGNMKFASEEGTFNNIWILSCSYLLLLGRGVHCITRFKVLQESDLTKTRTLSSSFSGSPCSSVTSESLPLGQTTHHSSPRQHRTPYNLEPLFRELQERREEIEMLKEKIDTLKVCGCSLFGIASTTTTTLVLLQLEFTTCRECNRKYSI